MNNAAANNAVNASERLQGDNGKENKRGGGGGEGREGKGKIDCGEDEEEVEKAVTFEENAKKEDGGDELEEMMVEGIDIHPPPDQCLTAIVHRFHF